MNKPDSPPYTPETLKRVCDLIEQETWERGHDSNTRLDSMFDSIDMVSIVLQIQNIFQIEITPKDLEPVAQIGTVGALATLVQAKVDALTKGE